MNLTFSKTITDSERSPIQVNSTLSRLTRVIDKIRRTDNIPNSETNVYRLRNGILV
jgi:hypothetical protein